MIDLHAVGRTLALLVACAGWPLWLASLGDVADAKQEAAMHERNYRQCVTRGAATVQHVATEYLLWRASFLEPLYERTPTQRTRPSVAEDGNDE